MMFILYVLGYIMAWPCQFIFFKKRVYYEDKKESNRWTRGKTFIVSNHTSLMDYMVTIFLFHFRRIFCLMSELVFSHGWFVSTSTKIMGGIKVDRRNYDFSFITTSCDLLEKKKMLIVYPEGRVEVEKKKLLYFHPTYLLIALRSNTPITPIYMNGDYGFKKRCHIVIGKKINLSDYCTSKNPTKEELLELNKIVTDKMASLEKICHEKMVLDKYGHGPRLKYLLKDLGRAIAKFISLFFKLKFKGNKKLRSVKGGGVVVMNHQSFKDPLMMYKIFPNRRVYILTAEVVFDGHKVRSFFLRQLGCVRVDRNIYDVSAMERAVDIVKAGNLLVVFASGHIDKENNSQFKTGAAYIASRAGMPIYTVLNRVCGKKNVIYLGKKYDTIDSNGKRIKSKDLKIMMDNIHDELYKLGDIDGVSK